MFKLNNSITSMFSTPSGMMAFNRVANTIDREGMLPLIDNGVLIGFSGGGDSVFLTAFLVEYRRRTGKDFPLLAVHINHCIRGEEADRDEQFARDFSLNLGIEFKSLKIDVPCMAKEYGLGLEEAARNARYSAFRDIIEGRNDISTIAIAHNATDNCETIIMNILRGSGLSGICGIKPVRENIIRPIIGLSKQEIISLLDESGISYVTDSSNLASDYTRNYVRNEILPLFTRLSDNPEAAFTRLSENLRYDLDYITKDALSYISTKCNETIYAKDIRKLHHSLKAKVLSILIHENTGEYPEEKHLSAIIQLMNGDNFSFSLPGEKNLICQRGICSFIKKSTDNSISEEIFSIKKGENKINGTNLTVFVGEIDKSSLNVYNFSIQVKLSFDIINDGLILRFKSDGDSYVYSGMTHKLKKVFNDRNIQPMERSLIPILCDSKGIVVVPGMSVRDGATSNISENNITVTFAYGEVKPGEREVFTALLRK